MKGQATVPTSLYIGVNNPSTKYNIKSYPDIGSSPDAIEVTDFDDEMVKNVEGVGSVESISFTANYLEDKFGELHTLFEENEELHFMLKFGTEGEEGLFVWEGFGAITVVGGDVNSAREMTIISYPTSDIEDVTDEYFIIHGETVTATASGNVIKIVPDSKGQMWRMVDENGNVMTGTPVGG